MHGQPIQIVPGFGIACVALHPAFALNPFAPEPEALTFFFARPSPGPGRLLGIVALAVALQPLAAAGGAALDVAHRTMRLSG